MSNGETDSYDGLGISSDPFLTAAAPLLVPGLDAGGLLPPPKIEPFLVERPPSWELDGATLSIFGNSSYAGTA